jgi:hypothetical protein
MARRRRRAIMRRSGTKGEGRTMSRRRRRHVNPHAAAEEVSVEEEALRRRWLH